MTFTKLLTVYSAAFAVALVAWVLNIAHMYWMAGVLLLLPLAGKLFGKLEHRGVELFREMPQTGHLGDVVRVTFRAVNRIAIPKLHLCVSDLLPEGLVPMEPSPVPVHLPPSGRDEASYELRLQRRGEFRIEHAVLLSADPMGLTFVRTEIPLRSEILVYPRFTDLPPRMLPPSVTGGQAPLEASGRQGEGAGFFGVREYRPGDPLRHVHWRTAARFGRLAVVEWEAEESTDALIAVETSEAGDRDLGPARGLDLAAGMAASLAAAVLTAGDAVRLLVPGTTDPRPAPVRGMESLPAILEALARMRTAPEQSLGAMLRDSAGNLTPGTLVCWITAIPDPALGIQVLQLRESGLRPVIYALIPGAVDPAGVEEWSAVAARLESHGIPVVRVSADDEVARGLVS
ncbi:MAG: DUF58 domain-containing protein [Armatimonadota bacterium]